LYPELTNRCYTQCDGYDDYTDTMSNAVQFGEHVDDATFSQILEMDEDSHDFSLPLVINFFEQADETFEKMDVAM